MLIDDEDVYLTFNSRWFLSPKGYAFGSIKNQTKRFHRCVVDAQKGTEIDHIDGNKLNNQKSNLRVCSSSQNSMNRGKQKNNLSGYKGVSWYKNLKKWRASIQIQGKKIHLGYFEKIKDAETAYDEIAKRLFGVFSKQK